jgi:hypothetical protein
MGKIEVWKCDDCKKIIELERDVYHVNLSGKS